MAAFERIKSGIHQLDETLDNIRLGDNVVWHVSNLKTSIKRWSKFDLY